MTGAGDGLSPVVLVDTFRIRMGRFAQFVAVALGGGVGG